jgi:hypothetical protein
MFWLSPPSTETFFGNVNVKTVEDNFHIRVYIKVTKDPCLLTMAFRHIKTDAYIVYSFVF